MRKITMYVDDEMGEWTVDELLDLAARCCDNALSQGMRPGNEPYYHRFSSTVDGYNYADRCRYDTKDDIEIVLVKLD